MPEQSPHRRPRLPTCADVTEHRTRGGADAPGSESCPEGHRDGDEAVTGLSDLLAGQVEMARSCFGIERLAILKVERDSGDLVLSARSPPLSALDDAPVRIGLSLDRLTPLSRCAVHAEERTVSTPAGAGSPREEKLLGLLGDSVRIIPLVGRQGLRCWRELDCRRHDCPAHQSSESRCWLVPDTLCRDGCEREAGGRFDWCLGCPAFSVQGVMAISLRPGTEASGTDTSRKFRRFVANVAAVMEADQSTRALLRLNRGLEKRVAEAVREREIALIRAAGSERLAATGKLVAGLAHQINNPLAVISMCVQSLRMGGNDAAGTTRKLEILATEVSRLSRLVSNLLDLARDRKINLTESDLGEVAEQAVNLARSSAARSGVKLDVTTTGGCRARVDRVLMQQVLVNLVANAIQATPREGRVDVSVREGAAGEGAGRTADIVVKDNGCGMPPDVLASAFDPFFTTKAQSGGIGLGLCLAASIIERHGGAITVESAAGEGATFTVKLPACDRRKDEEEEDDDGGEAAKGGHPSPAISREPTGRRAGEA